MGKTFGEKFEEALNERREHEAGYGLRTLARALAKGDKTKVESIRRRLNKYRPPKDGGAAEVQPTDPTRWEIEAALGLERDALRGDPRPRAIAADTERFLEDLAPLRRIWELGERIERGEVVITERVTS